jgi:soluble lytic murein transglycosylase-like protein
MTVLRARVPVSALALAALLCCASARAANADAPLPIEAAVSEAASAYQLPRGWIERVMAAESGRDPHAVSRAGALGLMQLMPATWLELRARLGLGADPFDVRDNIMAGSAYLRDMLDRFGAPGFLAAYNAGPGRYAQHLEGRARLPAETRAYVAVLSRDIAASNSTPASDRLAWRRARLFAVAREPSAGPDDPATPASARPKDLLFAVRSPGEAPPDGARNP